MKWRAILRMNNKGIRLKLFSLVDQLPDEALFEANEALQRILEFYKTESTPEITEQLPKRDAILLPVVESMDFPFDLE